jgi:excisionase family DNA binding protein
MKHYEPQQSGQGSSPNSGKPTRLGPGAQSPAHRLARESGKPLTTSELARLIGMSATFVRKEIDSGYLRAIRIGRGRKRVFRIPISEARRYIRTLGLL